MRQRVSTVRYELGDRQYDGRQSILYCFQNGEYYQRLENKVTLVR